MTFRRTVVAQRFLVKMSRVTNPTTTTTMCCCHAVSSKLAPDPPGEKGIFRRRLHAQSASATSSKIISSLPTGEKLLEKLRGLDIAKDRIRLDGLMTPPRTDQGNHLTVADAKKILRLSQLEEVKSRLRQMGKDRVTYSEFLEICAKDCSDVDQGVELAKLLDQSGGVIVLGNTVFLRPDQVVKAIRGLIPLPLSPNTTDPRLKELQEMEKQKAAIDKKAESYVKRELWLGLGCLVAQTTAFMRLTFWELTWDVMEPICFYVTSFYFMGCYVFFLRTSKEPSFEGFFQSRFGAKQKRLMKADNFDVQRYNELKRACSSHSVEASSNTMLFASHALEDARRT